MPAAAYDMPTSREQLRAELVERGVTSAEAQARVATLTDEEVAQVVAQIDSMPAGAGGGDAPFWMGMFVGGVIVAIILAPLIIAGTVVYQIAKHAGKGHGTAAPATNHPGHG